MSQAPRPLLLGHSPDPDDAFMFYAMREGLVDQEGLRFEHVLQDIETLNRRAMGGELEVTAVSLHAFAHLQGRYGLLSSGASIGDGYGPMVVSKAPLDPRALGDVEIAVPGTLTSAFLALKLHTPRFRHRVVPFDEIPGEVAAGRFAAGLLIHEGQLTYQRIGLHLCVDLGTWWKEETGLPLPLGVNVVRLDLGPELCARIGRVLRRSIEYALAHREPALRHALRYGRDLDLADADRFVGMYVNEFTRDFGPRGRAGVRLLLERGMAAGILPRAAAEPVFVG
ncbi:MAG: ABC transporter substrate-binding protein [Planctomycetes bacterium]|nr:ABC transporter substrate-binding protein [Planctomycetota bacterium]